MTEQAERRNVVEPIADFMTRCNRLGKGAEGVGLFSAFTTRKFEGMKVAGQKKFGTVVIESARRIWVGGDYAATLARNVEAEKEFLRAEGRFSELTDLDAWVADCKAKNQGSLSGPLPWGEKIINPETALPSVFLRHWPAKENIEAIYLRTFQMLNAKRAYIADSIYRIAGTNERIDYDDLRPYLTAKKKSKVGVRAFRLTPKAAALGDESTVINGTWGGEKLSIEIV